MKHKIVVIVCKYTSISTNVKLGFGGNCYLITGIKATKAIIRPAKLPIRSASPVSWKKIPKFIIPNNQSGTKMVNIPTEGNLYKGI